MTAKKPTFESQLKDLQAIVNHLEKGDLPLQDALTHYEKGIKLTRQCQEMLSQAEQKVAILKQQSLEDFADKQSSS